MAQADVQGSGLSHISLKAEQLDAWIIVGAHDVTRLIRGRIVNDQEVESTVRLLQDTLDCGPQERHAIVDRHEHCKLAGGVTHRAARISQPAGQWWSPTTPGWDRAPEL